MKSYRDCFALLLYKLYMKSNVLRIHAMFVYIRITFFNTENVLRFQDLINHLLFVKFSFQLIAIL